MQSILTNLLINNISGFSLGITNDYNSLIQDSLTRNILEHPQTKKTCVYHKVQNKQIQETMILFIFLSLNNMGFVLKDRRESFKHLLE